MENNILLFFVYPSPFPFYFGSALLVIGLSCLWIAHDPSRFFPVWGRKYDQFSSVVRPIGKFLIIWAWVEILAVDSLPELNWVGTINWVFFIIVVVGMLCDHFLRKVVLGIAVHAIFFIFFCSANWPGPSQTPQRLTLPMFLFLCSMGWMALSKLNLGQARSTLYSAVNDDPLIDTDFYNYHRHPQYLASLVLVFSSIHLFHPIGTLNDTIYFFRYFNFLIMTICVLCLVFLEDRDLSKRIGKPFEDYRKIRPGILVTLRIPGAKKSACVIAGLTIFVYAIIIYFSTNPSLSNPSGINPIFFAPDPLSISNSIQRHLSLTRINKHFGIYNVHSGGVIGQELSQEALDDFKYMLQKFFIFEPYPLTLFFCQQSFDITTTTNTFPNASVVDSLPFPLLCEDSYSEYALAYDFDGDGFPQVYIWGVHSYSKYPMDHDIEFLFATDDNTNTFHWILEERMKGEISPLLQRQEITVDRWQMTDELQVGDEILETEQDEI